jgi:hypothetical protein
MATLAIDREFTTTHWSVVLAAGQCDSPDAQQALGKLCRTYYRGHMNYRQRLEM